MHGLIAEPTHHDRSCSGIRRRVRRSRLKRLVESLVNEFLDSRQVIDRE